MHAVAMLCFVLFALMFLWKGQVLATHIYLANSNLQTHDKIQKKKKTQS